MLRLSGKAVRILVIPVSAESARLSLWGVDSWWNLVEDTMRILGVLREIFNMLKIGRLYIRISSSNEEQCTVTLHSQKPYAHNGNVLQQFLKWELAIVCLHWVGMVKTVNQLKRSHRAVIYPHQELSEMVKSALS